MNRGIDFGYCQVACMKWPCTKSEIGWHTRPGFVKCALQHGVCLLPAFTFASGTYTNLRAPLYVGSASLL